ncbi:MAG: DUF4365 domain-containing protein [Acidobacteria bacterium]|nr:DUF4365 domain-containing protein [Acidobacteriota bacterium]
MSDEKGERARRSLGPLPSSPESSDLERKSWQALQACLPADQLIPRDDRANDFGVDFSLEVVYEGHPTNCRARCQLKARSGTQATDDGSIRVRVTTKNLNYLLNGEAPLYFLS